MSYFAFLNFEILECSNYNDDYIKNEMEELGLYWQIKKGDDYQLLPNNTFIGQYKIDDKDNLKNMLYSEVKQIFDLNGVKARLFIAVSENAVIGVEDLSSDSVSTGDGDPTGGSALKNSEKSE